MFMQALSKLHEQRETLIADCEALKGMLSDTSEIDGERARIAAEQSETETLAAALIQQNAMTAMNQSEFNRRYEEYVKSTTPFPKGSTSSTGSSKSGNRKS